MTSIEKSFPRGGTANIQINGDNNTSNIIFGATQKKVKKTQKPKDGALTQTDNDNTNEQLQVLPAETLTYDTLQDHMLLMGVVKEVGTTSLQISLPGRMTARVLASDISEAYARQADTLMDGEISDYLHLQEIFAVGRIVYGRVVKTEDPEKHRTSILMSLKPSVVNSSLKHTNIKNGFIFSGAIQEIQDHGCIVETGIEGLQAFLVNANAAQKHHVGELVFLKVKQIEHTKDRSTCQCTKLEQDQLKVKSKTESNLDYILPGSIVKFKVTKQHKTGIEGNILSESFRGYVNEHHLGDALHVPTDYEVNEEYLARVLYVMPLTKFVYLTFNLNISVPTDGQEQEADEEPSLRKGSIVEKARVMRHGTGGIVVLLNQKYKGLISYASLRSNNLGNFDQDTMLAKYTQKSKHSVRILGYDVMEALYYCSDDPSVLNEKLYTLDDLHAGEIVSARIVKPESKIGGYCVKLGKVNGIIERLQLAPNVRYEVGQRLRCRVLEISLERKTCYLSNRSEYLSKGVQLLTTLDAAEVGKVFTGSVVKCEESMILVKFCNGIKGVLHKQRINGLLENSFFEGQTTKFRITGRNGEQVLLTLPEDKFQLGEICPVEVTNVLDSGLEIKITYASDDFDESQETEEFVGLIPERLLSDYVDLQSAQKRTHPAGTYMNAACILQNIFSLREVPYFSENLTKDWQTVQVGDILRAHVKHVTQQVVELQMTVRNYNKLVKLHIKMLCLSSVPGAVPIKLEPDQLLYVKVLSKEVETKTLTVSAKLTDVWDGKLTETAKLVESYLDEVEYLRNTLQGSSAAIAKFKVGGTINVKFKGLNPETNDWIYTVNEAANVTGLLVQSLAGTSPIPAVGSKQSAVILWIDYANDLLLISNKKQDIEHISSKNTELPENLIGKSGIKAKVLLKLDNIVVCSLKKSGTNPLVICPIRLHPNDVENSASASLRQGEFCNLAFIHDKLPIAVPETVWKLWKGVKRVATDNEVPVKPKKIKQELSILTNGKKVKTEKKSNGQVIFEDKRPSKVNNLNSKASEAAVAKARLPGITSFWDTDVSALNGKRQEIASSDEDDDDANNEASASKKKRLSSKEKAKAEVKEEQRLRATEERNADPNQRPETIDQFERLVLAEPNSSKCWIQYMSFLLSNTEIDKAREIARRAIKTISFRETKELRNIWMALLNLELSYNSSNFDDVLKEALSHTDPLETYLSLVDVLKSHNMKERLVNVLNLITRKFRTELQVWRVAADAYFWMDMADRVQPTLQRALGVLPKNQHINCIVAFAKLFAQHDDNAMAQTLLDDIVTSYPKRIDIWVLYVDMLIKCGLIESARNVLERAVLQKLQPDKMLVIYKKYLDFEEKHGTEVNAARVKQLAEQYVKSQNKTPK